MIKKQTYIPALGYDFLTGFYDLVVRLTMPEEKFRGRLIEELALNRDERVLEFGFGTGQNLILAKKACVGAEICGLEIDPRVKQIAARKIKDEQLEIPLYLYEGGSFPFDNETFDTVYSSLVFHQLKTEIKKACLGEIKRVLKKGGRLVIGDWGQPQTAVMRAAFYSIQLVDSFETTADSVEGRLPEFMSEAGFENVKESGRLNTLIGTYCYYTGRI